LYSDQVSQIPGESKIFKIAVCNSNTHAAAVQGETKRLNAPLYFEISDYCGIIARPVVDNYETTSSYLA
jgi:hypothetical protein